MYRGCEVPQMLLLDYIQEKHSKSTPDQHSKDIIQQESLGTDML